MEIGKTYGLWTAIKQTDKKNARAFLWLFRCACGNEKILQTYCVKRGTSKGCGCKLTDELHRFNRFCKSYIIKENGCWIWQRNKAKQGYGRINNMLAHRYSFSRFKGSIPNGMCVCHNCPGGDNRACVNPEHLWLGTLAENILDKGPKGKQNQGERQSCAKLRENQVKEIKNRLKLGAKLEELGIEYNVSHGLISHIKQGRAWKHIK